MRLGIYFGTCYSSAALLLDGVLRPVKEPLRPLESCFPSTVCLTKQGTLVLTPPLKPTKEQKNSLIQNLKRAALPLGLISFGILNGIAGNPVLVVVGVVSGCLALAQPYLDSKRTNPNVKQALLLMLGALTFAFLSLSAAPARAQFFQNAETFFTDTFTSSGEAVPIVFNTLRALYIVYLAVAFIGVFNSVRQDEDWVAAARTPILVVITVTLADILIGFIAG